MCWRLLVSVGRHGASPARAHPAGAARIAAHRPEPLLSGAPRPALMPVGGSDSLLGRAGATHGTLWPSRLVPALFIELAPVLRLHRRDWRQRLCRWLLGPTGPQNGRLRHLQG